MINYLHVIALILFGNSVLIFGVFLGMLFERSWKNDSNNK